MQCAIHSNVETNLACGKCDKPICPRCLIHTPVGARCRECANLRPLPIYQVSTLMYLRAGAVALGLSLVTALLWWILLGRFFYLSFISLIVALGLGYAVGELISRSVNRKRGVGLQALAVTSIVLSYVFRTIYAGEFILDVRLIVFESIGLGLASIMAASRLRR